MSEFNPGDKVADPSGEEYTISYGPYVGPEGETYLVADSREVRHPVRRVFLSPIPPADPRVDVVARAIAESDGEPFDVPGTRTHDFGYRRNARAVLDALDAMPQFCKCSEVEHVAQEGCEQAPRLVRDRDGDVWEESDDGTWIGVTFPADVFGSYRELAERYGPLTDV